MIIDPRTKQYLINNYPNTPNKELAEHLVCTPNMVSKMAAELDLRKSEQYKRVIANERNRATARRNIERMEQRDDDVAYIQRISRPNEYTTVYRCL